MAAFSPHAGIELEEIGNSQRAQRLKAPTSSKISASRRSVSAQRSSSNASNASIRPQPPAGPDSTPLHVQMTWKEPRINLFRLPLLFFDFFIFGMNDASYGALLPALEAHYGLSYFLVSLVFLTPFVGYIFAALFSSPLHFWAGQRGIAFVAPILRLITYVVVALHPPYPVVVAIWLFAGFGNGLVDAGWNAYLGDIQSTNQILGLMHSCHGLGATISPLVITTMLDKYKLPWWDFYYIMIILSAIDSAAGTAAFWAESGKEFRRKNVIGEGEDKGRTRQSLKNKITWILSGFLLFYVGTEVSLGGWIITFMTTVRQGSAYQSGLIATGFWLGITLGRLILGFVTPKIGERLAVIIYLVAATVFQIIFWVVPSFVVSAVVVGIQGFFLGPLFPAAVVAAAKLLPKKLHVSSIGISSAIGGAGAALLPFMTGAIVNEKGVSTLQPIILAFLVCQLGFWILLPKFPRNTHDE